jgi:hypothetical protein
MSMRRLDTPADWTCPTCRGLVVRDDQGQLFPHERIDETKDGVSLVTCEGDEKER